MEEEWKNYFFCLYFWHISLCFYSNSKLESSLDEEFNSTSNEYPHCILLTNPATPKTRNSWKNVMMTSSSLFLGISCFWGREVCQKYALWVLIGCGIKFHIQRVPTQHTFDGPCYPKNKKYLKKWNDDFIISFLQVFLVFGVEGSIKGMLSGYSLDVEFNSASNELSRSKFE